MHGQPCSTELTLLWVRQFPLPYSSPSLALELGDYADESAWAMLQVKDGRQKLKADPVIEAPVADTSYAIGSAAEKFAQYIDGFYHQVSPPCHRYILP